MLGDRSLPLENIPTAITEADEARGLELSLAQAAVARQERAAREDASARDDARARIGVAHPCRAEVEAEAAAHSRATTTFVQNAGQAIDTLTQEIPRLRQELDRERRRAEKAEAEELGRAKRYQEAHASIIDRLRDIAGRDLPLEDAIGPRGLASRRELDALRRVLAMQGRLADQLLAELAARPAPKDVARLRAAVENMLEAAHRGAPLGRFVELARRAGAIYWPAVEEVEWLTAPPVGGMDET